MTLSSVHGVAVALTVVLGGGGCLAPRQGAMNRTAPERELWICLVESDSLREAIRDTMADARKAVDEYGATERAMDRIGEALGRLARESQLKEQVTLHDLHGGGATVALLATEGDEGLTLTLARFEPGVQTPVHDHGAWAVVYVVEGQDQYVHWERLDDGSDPQHTKLRVTAEDRLGPGDSVYWLDPPHDIHSQMAIDEATWELVLFGKNPLQSARQYFDLESGRVTTRSPR